MTTFLYIRYFTGTGLLNGLDPSETHVYSIADDGNACNKKYSDMQQFNSSMPNQTF